ncbi:hypothetical protein [Emticicia soli]|uniref:Uncharacterized protein n=1 Tax=Emticicia soli TaxID=2027878 RepID=A0ABW5JD95_9BACT
MTVEQKYIAEIVKAENIQTFTAFNRLFNKLLYDKSEAATEIDLLRTEVSTLKKTIAAKDAEIKKLKLKQKKQDFIEKNKENKKESVKIVANKVRQSEEKAQLKKIIEDLIKEIDVCVELLNEE